MKQLLVLVATRAIDSIDVYVIKIRTTTTVPQYQIHHHQSRKLLHNHLLHQRRPIAEWPDKSDSES